jgi:Zn-dependent protease with chaperone function
VVPYLGLRGVVVMVSVLVVACLSYPAMRLYARRVERSEGEPVEKLHILLKLTAYLLTVLVLSGIGVGLAALHPGGSWKGILAVVLPVGFMGALLVVQGVVGIRLERRADDYAAAAVGREPLCRALERLAEQNMLKRRTSWFWNVMQQHPGLETRIERLAK